MYCIAQCTKWQRHYPHPVLLSLPVLLHLQNPICSINKRPSHHLHESLSIHFQRVLKPIHILVHQRPRLLSNSIPHSVPHFTARSFSTSSLSSRPHNFSGHLTTVTCVPTSIRLVSLERIVRKGTTWPRN